MYVLYVIPNILYLKINVQRKIVLKVIILNIEKFLNNKLLNFVYNAMISAKSVNLVKIIVSHVMIIIIYKVINVLVIK